CSASPTSEASRPTLTTATVRRGWTAPTAEWPPSASAGPSTEPRGASAMSTRPDPPNQTSMTRSSTMLDEHLDPVGVEPIAIVGLACRVPGAGSADEFWRNLAAGVESLSVYSLEEQAANGVAAHVLADPAFVPAAMALADM